MTKTKLYTPQITRFTGQWWFDGLRNFFFVAIISILIWVYADMDVSKDESFMGTITLSTSGADDLALLSEKRIQVHFKLRGTRRALGLFQRDMEKNNSLFFYDVSGGYESGENDIRTEDILNISADLSRRGLSIVSSVPGRVSFVLARRVRQIAKVVLDTSGASFNEEPKIDPAEIVVRIAESDLERIRNEQNLAPTEQIELKTRNLDLRNFPTAQMHTVEVEILPPTARFPVTLETKTVKVTIKIDQRTDEKIFTVTTQVRFPHTWTEDGTWKEFEMVKKDPLEWQPQVTLRGAKKDLDRLRAEDIAAQIMLTEDDKSPVGSWLKRVVIVQFPADMDLELVGEAPAVHFKFLKRTAPAPAP